MSQLNNELLEKMTALAGYSYRMWKYSVSHSQLTLRATHRDKPHHNVHLTFVGVFYIQMPNAWSADLELGSTDEARMISKRAGIELHETKSISLFKAVSSNGVIYILGTLVVIEYDVEPVY